MSKHPYEDNVTPFLDLVQLKQEERRPERVHKKMFKMILAKCHEKVRKINKTTDFRSCYYDIPWIMPGYPGYDLEDVNRFIVHNLLLNGLWAQRINSQRIYISWKQEDLDLNQYRQQSKKMAPKHNLYKIQVSPLANDPGMIEALPPGDRKAHMLPHEETGKPVMMLRYDDRYDDLVPVNTKKMTEMYPDLSTDLRSLDVSDPGRVSHHNVPVQGHFHNADRPSLVNHVRPRAPEYADRYNERSRKGARF